MEQVATASAIKIRKNSQNGTKLQKVRNAEPDLRIPAKPKLRQCAPFRDA
jgi:hypothetical protein